MLRFKHYIGKDVALLPDGSYIKHITWMGVVAKFCEHGTVIWYMHSPNLSGEG